MVVQYTRKKENASKAVRKPLVGMYFELDFYQIRPRLTGVKGYCWLLSRVFWQPSA